MRGGEEIYNSEDIEPSYYYDLVGGKLIVGEVAYAEFLEQGNHPSDVPRLKEVILDQNINLTHNSYERLDVSTWAREDYIAFGQWVTKLLSTTDEPVRVNRDILKRLDYLGVGPPPCRITNRLRFGSLSNFYAEAGIPKTHRIGMYKDWSKKDFILHLRRLGKSRHSRPTEEYLWERQQKGVSEPSPHIISRVFDSFGNALELAGYPNIWGWQEEDYLWWGVTFMLANNGQIPTAGKIDYLSRRQHGPSSRAIINNFTKLRRYQEEVQVLYTEEIERRTQEKADKLEIISDEIKDDTLPSELFRDISDDSSIIKTAAMYKVAKELIPDLAEGQYWDIARSTDTAQFVSTLKRMDQTLSNGDIEEAANMLQAHDDIWPMDEYMDVLHIPPGTLLGRK